MRDDRFELERAITQNELALHYQPIFDISGDALRGVEALIRWKHPQKGLVSPQAFLPTAEREGLMHDLTAWVLREALLQASVWREDGLALNVSVNIAAKRSRRSAVRASARSDAEDHRRPVRVQRRDPRRCDR
jgi:EAL domain-containing protein (putative c-di-GMP-specific phosphodiesterase class I)